MKPSKSATTTRQGAPKATSRASGAVTRNAGSSSTQKPSAATRNAAPSQEGSSRTVTSSSGTHRTPPADRGRIDYNKPSRFYDHGHHYYGYRIHSLPPRHSVHYHFGRRYYYYDGLYYYYRGGVYYVCRPPFGYYFEPDYYYYTPWRCRVRYYAYADHQYHIINDNYNTIAQQNAIIAQNNATIARQQAELQAQQAKQAQMASESYQLAMRLGLMQSYAAVGQEYFYDDGVFFVMNPNGRYETIIPPAGALVEELPDDYEVVVLKDGREYFKVDETIYRMTVSDGKAYFEVLGQLQDYSW